MMLVSMILDPEACISDAGFFSVGRTNGRTDKAILGVGRVTLVCQEETRQYIEDKPKKETS